MSPKRRKTKAPRRKQNKQEYNEMKSEDNMGMSNATALHLMQCAAEATSLKSEADAINPSYYKDIIPGIAKGVEFIHLMEHQHTVEEMAGYCKIAAKKYQTRSGQKDPSPQEYRKAAWYLEYLADMLERSERGEYPRRTGA